MLPASVRLIATAAVLFLSGLATAEPVLLGRSGPDSGFLIPANSGMSNNTLALNDAGEATIRISTLGTSGDRGIWVGDGISGAIVATASPDWFIFDADINNAGEVVWSQTDSPANGIYRWDPVAGSASLITAEPLGTSSWGSPQNNDAGDIGYRATFGGGGRAWVSRAAGGGIEIHAAEAAIQPGSPWDFLFTPAFNAQRQIGGKALLTSGGNQLILTDADGAFSVVASDQTADGSSSFSGFDNSPAINDAGQFAFIAGTTDGGRGVFIHDGGGIVELAREGQAGIGDIEFFAPVIDNDGRVAFRAFVDGGRRAIWLADEDGVERLVGAGDLVTSDLGPARIDSPSGVEFSGGIAINQSGEIGFVAVLTEPDDVNDVQGLGVFRLAFDSELIFADGFEIPQVR